MQNTKHPFNQLSPELILSAIKTQGYAIDGCVTALNSYENRVYQIGIEDALPLIVKFYRPDRWNRLQIQEEHDFCLTLKNHDLPVVVPLKDKQGQSLFEFRGFLFALFPRTGGYAPELDYQENLAIMGRTLARLHNIGMAHKFKHRPTLDNQSFGKKSMDFVAESFIPFEYKSAYLQVCQEIMFLVSEKMQDAQNISVHGDLHVGNILMRDDVPNLVDFDDARLAPAIQDIWMLLSGDAHEQEIQLQKIIPAYQEFRDFPFAELNMIESLRTLRMIHHTAWLAKRWDDPAFPTAFSWFNTHQFWQQHIADLRQQLQALSHQEL